MVIHIRKNLGLMGPGMQEQQDMAALMGHQAGDFMLAGTPAAQRAPQMQPLNRTLDPDDQEAARQLTGEVFSPGAPAAPPTRTVTADTPAQAIGRMQYMSSNRQGLADQVDVESAFRTAETLAPAQLAQKELDNLRSMSAGYQQRDTTGDFVAMQQQSQEQMAADYAQDYAWGLMPDEEQRVVDSAILRLAQGVG